MLCHNSGYKVIPAAQWILPAAYLDLLIILELRLELRWDIKSQGLGLDLQRICSIVAG